MAASSGILSLFVQGEEPSYARASLNLALYATTGSGVFGAFPLFCYNTDERRGSGILPLFVHAGGRNPASGILSLYATGGTAQLSATLNLYAANSGVTASLNLYASGQGTTPGSTPLSASLPLFVKRPEESFFNLYVHGQPYPASGLLNLYAQGYTVASGVLNLSVPNVQGESSASLDLYANGW